MKLDLLDARRFFADFFYGEHHLPSKIKPIGGGWYVVTPHELASTDYNELTRLVLMAHTRCIRVAVQPHGLKLMKIVLSAREPDNTSLERGHPSINEAIVRHEHWLKEHQKNYVVHPNEGGHYVQMPRNKPIARYDLAGDKVDTFPSQASCAKALGITRGGVNNAIVRGSVVLEKYRLKMDEH